jgi:hypothetical protein
VPDLNCMDNVNISERLLFQQCLLEELRRGSRVLESAHPT